VIQIDPNYVAGFFDGEGCARTTKIGGGKGGRRRLWKPVIEITNTNEEVMRKIHEFIGVGKFYIYRHKHNPKMKDQYRICIWGFEGITKFCDLIMDKTIIKKDILKLVREFATYVEETRVKHKTHLHKYGSMGWTDEDIQFVKDTFVIPIRNLIRASSNKAKRTIII